MSNNAVQLFPDPRDIDALGELVVWSRDCAERFEDLERQPGSLAEKRARAVAIALEFTALAAGKLPML